MNEPMQDLRIARLEVTVGGLKIAVDSLNRAVRKVMELMSAESDILGQVEGEVSDLDTLVDNLGTHLTNAEAQIEELKKAAGDPARVQAIADNLGKIIAKGQADIASVDGTPATTTTTTTATGGTPSP